MSAPTETRNQIASGIAVVLAALFYIALAIYAFRVFRWAARKLLAGLAYLLPSVIWQRPAWLRRLADSGGNASIANVAAVSGEVADNSWIWRVIGSKELSSMERAIFSASRGHYENAANLMRLWGAEEDYEFVGTSFTLLAAAGGSHRHPALQRFYGCLAHDDENLELAESGGGDDDAVAKILFNKLTVVCAQFAIWQLAALRDQRAVDVVATLVGNSGPSAECVARLCGAAMEKLKLLRSMRREKEIRTLNESMGMFMTLIAENSRDFADLEFRARAAAQIVINVQKSAIAIDNVRSPNAMATTEKGE